MYNKGLTLIVPYKGNAYEKNITVQTQDKLEQVCKVYGHLKKPVNHEACLYHPRNTTNRNHVGTPIRLYFINYLY